MDPSPPQQDRTKERITEVNFLKDLYTFMKKRDTPIERIPHLGFKQIDLTLMYQTVMRLGGYEQVTAQQLWKQVYNKLGGNPRSTSAATCTRRHYEKLLLPYECHVKGITMKVLPQIPHKNLQYLHYSKEMESDGQRAPKRKMLSLPLHQVPHQVPHQADPRVFFMHLNSTPYPNSTGLSPYVQISHPVVNPYSPPTTQPPFPFPPLSVNPPEKKPLDHLRYLAKQYKFFSGLSGPLNPVKSLDDRTDSIPTSSFSAPPPSKNPKFLNTPYPLYSVQQPRLVTNNLKDDETAEPVLAAGTPEDSGQYVIDLTSKRRSLSCDSQSKNHSDGAQKPNSPKTDYQIAEQTRSPDTRLRNLPPSPVQQNSGKMEIEIPLSVFQKWLQLCGPLASMQGVKELQPQIQEEQPSQRNCSDRDLLHGNLTFQINSQHHDENSVAQDLRIRKVPSPKSPNQAPVGHLGGTQNHHTSYKPPAQTGFLKERPEVCHFDQRDANKDKSSWNVFNQPSTTPAILDYTHGRVQPEPANEERIQTERSEKAPSAVYMGNSSSDPMLQLTKDEVMKLKRMISTSL